jgi:hypothetical protein
MYYVTTLSNNVKEMGFNIRFVIKFYKWFTKFSKAIKSKRLGNLINEQATIGKRKEVDIQL